jgi:hypothetical protein
MVNVTLLAVGTAALVSTAVVALVTDAMVVKLGMPVPVMLPPTSEAVKAAVADVTVIEAAVVWPSVTTRGTVGTDGVEVQRPPMQMTEALMKPPARLVVS